MPIYEQTYRRYEARAPLRAVRFWPITREALRLILSRRAFLLLLIAAWIPFIVDMVRLYIVSRYPQARGLGEINPQFFGAFLNRQLGFVTRPLPGGSNPNRLVVIVGPQRGPG